MSKTRCSTVYLTNKQFSITYLLQVIEYLKQQINICGLTCLQFYARDGIGQNIDTGSCSKFNLIFSVINVVDVFHVINVIDD